LRLIAGGPEPGLSLALALALAAALVVVNEFFKGSLKSLTLPLGLLAGTALFRLCLGGPAGAGAPAAQAAAPRALFIAPSFEAGPFAAFLLCFLVLTINELGSVEAVGRALNASGMDGRVRRGVGVAGIGSVASGFLGVIGPVDFSMSAGLIAASGFAAKIAFVPAALALIACAFAPGLIEALVSIPKPVMGAVLLYTMVSQLAGGLLTLVSEKAVSGYSQGVVVGFPLMAALVVSFSPPSVLEAFPAVLNPVIGNGFVIGAILVFFLEHALLRSGKPPASPGASGQGARSGKGPS
jgi:xanthine/uracil permease